jgi:hypothetical protein
LPPDAVLSDFGGDAKIGNFSRQNREYPPWAARDQSTTLCISRR